LHSLAEPRKTFAMLPPSRFNLRHWIVVIGCFTAVSLSAAETDRLAFPGAQGFGRYAVGGRGGQIIRVTTLKATGPGSITEAIQTKGARIVVFEVGGVIDLDGRSLAIREPFVTIAGQTAPSPGITLIKGGLSIATHDVVMQHLAVRPGEAGQAKKSGWEADGLSTSSAYNVIVDHCSFTWATDENLSASGPRFTGETVEEWRDHTSHHITFSHCLIAEGLSNSTHSKGEHSKGTLIHDNATFVSLIGNLYASNMGRNPLAKGGVWAVVVNNWIANPGRQSMHSGLVKTEWGTHPWATSRLAVVGNVMEHGPDTRTNLALLRNNTNTPLELYLEDNLAFDRQQKPVAKTTGEFHKLETRPFWPEGLTPLPASKVKEFVAREAGSRPWDRDLIDQRIVQAALAGRGKIIDSETDVGGYPQRPATTAPFQESDWNLEHMQLQPRR
jgi:hypothetical protein